MNPFLWIWTPAWLACVTLVDAAVMESSASMGVGAVVGALGLLVWAGLHIRTLACEAREARESNLG